MDLPRKLTFLFAPFPMRLLTRSSKPCVSSKLRLKNAISELILIESLNFVCFRSQNKNFDGYRLSSKSKSASISWPGNNRQAVDPGVDGPSLQSGSDPARVLISRVRVLHAGHFEDCPTEEGLGARWVSFSLRKRFGQCCRGSALDDGSELDG